MPTFDPKSSCIVARIVYDGPARAGKTTNLVQLCDLIHQDRRSELVSHRNAKGETDLFDWLSLDAGMIAGHRLQCDILSVPGQRELAHRRAALLDLADVVVFVSGSTASSLDDARPRWSLLARLHDEEVAAPRLLLQANKQDLADALPPGEVAAALGLPPGCKVIGATAVEAKGVRETATAAIRLAADAVQQRVARAGSDRAPESLLPSVLDPAQLKLAIEKLTEDTLRGSVWELAPSQDPAMPMTDPQQAIVTGADTNLPLSPVEPSSESGGRSRRPKRPSGHRTIPFLRRESAAEHPPWPSAEVRSTLIWPGVRGRKVLAETAFDEAVAVPLSGRGAAVLYAVPPLCLKTSERRCYRDEDAARQAVVNLARAKLQLGPLMVPDTLLVVSEEDERYWLWTITSLCEPLDELFARTLQDGEHDALVALLKRWTDTLTVALNLAARRGVVLDLALDNFAVVDGVTRYLDDDIVAGNELVSFGRAALDLVADLEMYPAALDWYGAALRRALGELDRSALGSLGVRQSLERYVPSCEGEVSLRRDLLASL